jgi:4-amino-4-deoxy-L-arabinose transferase-like glycosyltransferase
MRTLVIIALAGVLFVHGLGAISLWDPDEPKQAVVAQEMMGRLDYIHPTLNGLPYLENPPLYAWLVVLSSRIAGRVNEFSARLPSALAAMCLLLVVYSLGRRLDHEVSGFLSALILATNYQFLSSARESTVDMTFALFVGLAVFLSYIAIERERNWLLPLALLPSLAAVLTKGLSGLVISTAIVLLYALFAKRFRAAFLPLCTGFILSLLLASAWFVLSGGATGEVGLLQQSIARTDVGFDHLESYWYYLCKLFVNFLPWSVALPFAVVFAYRRRLWLPLVWLVFTFLYFGLLENKKAACLLSCYPACAILVGIFLKEHWYEFVERRWTTALLCLFSLPLLALPAILFPAIQRVPIIAGMFRGDVILPSIMVIVLAASALAFLVSIIRKTPAQGFLALFIYLVFLGFLFHSHYLPAEDRTRKSIRPIVDGIERIEGRTSVYTFGFSSPSLIFYLGKPIPELKDPSVVPAEGDDIVVVAKEKDNQAEQFKQSFPYWTPVEYGKKKLLVLARKDGR